MGCEYGIFRFPASFLARTYVYAYAQHAHVHVPIRRNP